MGVQYWRVSATARARQRGPYGVLLMSTARLYLISRAIVPYNGVAHENWPSARLGDCGVQDRKSKGAEASRNLSKTRWRRKVDMDRETLGALCASFFLRIL